MTRHVPLCRIVAFALLTLAPGVASAAAADAYPSRPIRMIVPFPPGGGTDLIARLIQPAMTSALGQQVVIDNRGGAQGTLGTDIAAKSVPDGYTIVIAEIGATAVAPALIPKLPFSVAKDFAPITMLTQQPYVLSVHPSVPVRSFQELGKYAQSKAGGLNYGSGNTTVHVGQELLFRTASLKMTHIPYRGSGPAMAALLGNEVQVLLSGPAAALPQAKAGKIRSIAVTSLKRTAELPDVATLDEQGLKGFEIRGWYGLMAPVAVPKPVIARLNAELGKILSDGPVAKQFRDRGFEPAPTTPEEFGMYLRSELARWSKAVKDYGITSSE